MKIQTQCHKAKDIEILNEDSNKLLAKFITISTFSGSVINFTARMIFTNENRAQITALSFFLIALGMISAKLGKCKHNQRLVTHILSMISAFTLLSLILLFRYNGGITVWSISLLCLIIGVVGVNKIAIIYNTIAAIFVEIYLWILHPDIHPHLDSSDYLSRIGIYLIALMLAYVVNSMLVERMRKNSKHIEDIEAKNDEIITLHNEIYTLVSESTNDGIWSYDLKNNKQIYSKWWINVLGYTEDEILSMGDWLSLIHKDDLNFIENEYSNYVNHKIDHYENECRMITKSGNYLWIKVKVKGLFYTDGSPYMMVGAYTDITPLKEKEDRLKRLAFYDSLTGLPNRHHFMDNLNSSLELAAKDDAKLYVVFIDLDNFKKVNDCMGHYYGDILLKEVSNRFNQVITKSCFLGRLGGDEFAIIIKEITEVEQVETYVKELMNSLRKPVMLNGINCNISASFGISTFPEDGCNVDELLRNADTAMYKAKETGKNNFKLFHKSMSAALLRKLDIENKLLTAIEKDELYLVYQPQFSLEDNKIRGFEALIRWNNKELGFVSPMDFIPLAEETGYIDTIGKWVLKTACSRFYTLQQEFQYYGMISVNVSPVQFKSSAFLDMIKEVLLETNLNPKYLELEITESVFIDSFENTIAVFNELKKLGIKISLDDFGTGYSSLSYLQQLPIDTLKIDKSFIKDINKIDIVRSIIDLVHNMNISVVAEGVETEEQLIYLKNAKCDDVQGFLLGKPSEEVETYLTISKNINM
ncbi:MAG: EAL domain-containing protein [Bacillota bacterium]|nr:EAL domain-containing protein [Bacillota bacterium]